MYTVASDADDEDTDENDDFEDEEEEEGLGVPGEKSCPVLLSPGSVHAFCGARYREARAAL